VERPAGGTAWVRLTALAIGAVFVLSAGCGGSSRASDASAEKAAEDAAGGSTSTTAASESGESGASKSGAKAGKDGGSPTTTTAPGAKGKASQATTTTLDPMRMELPITAEVSTACVRPGATQTITIKAPYGSGVGYQVVYSDGLFAMEEGHAGGNFGGYADEQGTFVHTFPVAATAPPGPASANVLGTHMDHGFGETHARFAVADALGRCESTPPG
jgi:hypothetical protein